MSETPTRDAKLVQLLNEAYTKEKQLETALQAHVQVTTRDDYAKRLKDHLKETKSHATQVSRRIKQLGGNPETVSLPGPEGLSKAAESVSDVVGKAKAAAQGPMHAVRGSGEQDKMLRNARTEYEDEAHEIATYTVIDSLATAVGDKQTAKLARDILRQEERMQQFLAELLPQLSVGVAHDEIPVSEINGQASHRRRRTRSARAPRAAARARQAAARPRPDIEGDQHGHGDKIGTDGPAGVAGEGGGRDSGAGGTTRAAGLGAGACAARGRLLRALGGVRRQDAHRGDARGAAGLTEGFLTAVC